MGREEGIQKLFRYVKYDTSEDSEHLLKQFYPNALQSVQYFIVVPTHGCTLETPGELLIKPVPRPHPQGIGFNWALG